MFGMAGENAVSTYVKLTVEGTKVLKLEQAPLDLPQSWGP